MKNENNNNWNNEMKRNKWEICCEKDMWLIKNKMKWNEMKWNEMKMNE